MFGTASRPKALVGHCRYVLVPPPITAALIFWNAAYEGWPARYVAITSTLPVRVRWSLFLLHTQMRWDLILMVYMAGGAVPLPGIGNHFGP